MVSGLFARIFFDESSSSFVTNNFLIRNIFTNADVVYLFRASPPVTMYTPPQTKYLFAYIVVNCVERMYLSTFIKMSGSSFVVSRP